MNPIESYMKESCSYYYESGSVKTTRKSKYCTFCDNDIPKGTGHIKFKLFNGEFYDANVCTECEEKYKIEFNKLTNGNYDNY